MVTGPDSVFVQFKSLNSSDVTIVIYTMVTEPESVFTQSGPYFLRWTGYIFTSVHTNFPVHTGDALHCLFATLHVRGCVIPC